MMYMFCGKRWPLQQYVRRNKLNCWLYQKLLLHILLFHIYFFRSKIVNNIFILFTILLVLVSHCYRFRLTNRRWRVRSQVATPKSALSIVTVSSLKLVDKVPPTLKGHIKEIKKTNIKTSGTWYNGPIKRK